MDDFLKKFLFSYNFIFKNKIIFMKFIFFPLIYLYIGTTILQYSYSFIIEKGIIYKLIGLLHLVCFFFPTYFLLLVCHESVISKIFKNL